MATEKTPEQREQFYTDMDSTATLEVKGINFRDAEPEAFAALMTRTARHMSAGTKIVLTLSPRGLGNPPEWLAWGMHITYGSGGGMFIGMIQRTKDGEFEFHS